jgi:hypothetical protein
MTEQELLKKLQQVNGYEDKLAIANGLFNIVAIKEKQIKYLLMQLGGYVMPTQMNAIIDKLKEIEEEVKNAELETD